MGDGDYRFRIMKNVGGNDYVESESVEETVKLSTEFAPFVIPNQFCMYDDASACVVKARELTAKVINEQIDMFKPTHFYVCLDEIYFGPRGVCPRCKGKDQKKLLEDYLHFVEGVLDARGGRQRQQLKKHFS